MLTFDQKQRFAATSIERRDLHDGLRDIGVIAFGFVALAALVVSMPETYKVMARYHNSALAIGLVQSWAALIVFELGAIISKLATLWFPEWKGWLNFLNILLIGFVFAANCVATYAYRPDAGAIGFAAMMPIFQLLFTWMTVARLKAVQVQRLAAAETREPTQAERLAATLAEAQERAFKALLSHVEQQMSVTVLPQPQLPASPKVPTKQDDYDVSDLFATPSTPVDDLPEWLREIRDDSPIDQRLVDREQAKDRIIVEARRNPTATKSQLARSSGVARTTLYDLLAELSEEGRIRLNGHVEVVEP